MSTPPASNGVFVVIPPSNASGLRPPPAILPTSMCQPPGIMQFEESPLGAQAPRATQPPDLRPIETFLTGEPKALGVREAPPSDLRQNCWAGSEPRAQREVGGWAGTTTRRQGINVRIHLCARQTRLPFPLGAHQINSKQMTRTPSRSKKDGCGAATPAKIDRSLWGEDTDAKSWVLKPAQQELDG